MPDLLDEFTLHRAAYISLAALGGVLLVWASALLLSRSARRCLCRVAGAPRALCTWVCSGRKWWGLQCQIYGTSFITFQVLVNIVYGIATAWWFYFNSYYQADELALTDADAAMQLTLLQLAPIFKPFMGIITDNFPIFGSTRGKYFILTATLASVCYFGVFFYDTGGENDFVVSTVLLFMINFFGYAWCGIILYSMTAEKAKLDLTNGAENLNTIQWGFYSLGSLFGDILAPFLLESLGGLDPREPDDNGYVPRSGARNATAACGILFAILACLGFLYEDKKPKKALAKPITQASGKPSLTEAAGSDDGKGGDSCFDGEDFKSQMKKLAFALDPSGPTQGAILYSIIFIFLTWAVIPDVSYSITYRFYTRPVEEGGLGFDPYFWSLIQILGDVAMLVASFMYGACLTNVGLRTLFVSLQVLNVLASIPDVVLAQGWNEQIGVSPKVFAPVCIFFYWFVWQLKLVPVYTLSAKICPAGVEGTLTSLISAMNDLGGVVALALGTYLTRRLGIVFGEAGSGSGGDGETQELGGLWIMYTVRTALNILPIFFVLLVPSEAKIAQVMELLDDGTSAPPLTSDDLAASATRVEESLSTPGSFRGLRSHDMDGAIAGLPTDDPRASLLAHAHASSNGLDGAEQDDADRIAI